MAAATLIASAALTSGDDLNCHSLSSLSRTQRTHADFPGVTRGPIRTSELVV